MVTTNVTHGGNFIVTAKDPAGPWSNPYFIEELMESIRHYSLMTMAGVILLVQRVVEKEKDITEIMRYGFKKLMLRI